MEINVRLEPGNQLEFCVGETRFTIEQVSGKTGESTLKKNGTKVYATKSKKSKKVLPKMRDLFQVGAIKPNDKVSLIGFPDSEATVLDSKFVIYNGEKLKYNAWGRKVTNWKSINIYINLSVNDAEKSLADIRAEKFPN